MFVLKVLGIILAVFFLLVVVEMINKASTDKYNYKFFDTSSAIAVAIGYYFCFFGYDWFMKALENHGDVLNGAILLVIGVIVLIVILYNNIKRTNLVMGVFFSIVQFLIYIPVSIIGLYVVMIMAAMLFQTKPVWVLNND